MTKPWRQIVCDGYDALSRNDRDDHDDPAHYRPWTELLLERLPRAPAAVLDLGCGCGVPVARHLANAGHRVTGVDISPVQLERARHLVPNGDFLLADLAEVTFPERCFDAVVCLYALIHLPNREQQQTIERIGSWLRPGGTLLATVGAAALTTEDPNWLASGQRMWWNHPDLETTRGWLRDAGFRLDIDRFVPEGDTGHQLLIATR